MIADFSARAGDPRVARNGTALTPYSEGIWQIASAERVQPIGNARKDVNEHFRCLLRALLPHTAAIIGISSRGSPHFDVLWESSYLYAGTGPVLETDCIRGIADLRASVGFDIYQIESPSGAST
jgi:hypothetical protein